MAVILITVVILVAAIVAILIAKIGRVAKAIMVLNTQYQIPNGKMVTRITEE